MSPTETTVLVDLLKLKMSQVEDLDQWEKDFLKEQANQDSVLSTVIDKYELDVQKLMNCAYLLEKIHLKIPLELYQSEFLFDQRDLLLKVSSRIDTPVTK
ncbi:hypothetical protein HOH87_05910 [bacterium]|nr:hypothetical protein [bacterium]